MTKDNGNTPIDPIPIPYSQQAEEALIGSALIDPGIMLTTKIKPADFYVHRHQWVWGELFTLTRSGITPDMVTLTEALDRRGKLEEIGGAAFLVSLISRTPSSLGAESYSRIVKGDAMRRSVLAKARQLTQAAFDTSIDINQAVSGAIRDLAVDASPDKSAVHIAEHLDALYDDVERRSKDPKDIWGIKTGFRDIDRYIGGLQLSETLYLAGEPGVGKSKLAVQIAVQIALMGIPVAIFSLEMSAEAVVRRIVSLHSKVYTRKLKTGRMEGDDWSDFTKSVGVLSEIPLYISDKSGLTSLELRAELARLKLEHGIQVAMIDYLLLMGDPGYKDEIAKSTALSREIHNITKELNISTITVNSVTKELMDGGTPTNKGVRGSGQLVHDADVIAFLTSHKPEFGEEKALDLVTLTFTKGRELDRGNMALDLYAFPYYPAFGDMDQRQVEVGGDTKTLVQKEKSFWWEDN